MRGLRVVVVKDGEPLPQVCAPWTFRTGNLCCALAARRHDVTWLTSTFDHNSKTFHAVGSTAETLSEGYTIQFLPCGSYRRNISFARWIHHGRYGLAVLQTLRRSPKPDVIVCCVPILEAAAACLFYGIRHQVPVVLDIQDPWPRVFVDYAPQRLRPLVRGVLSPYFWAARWMFSHAYALTSVSQGFLDWARELGRRDEDDHGLDKVVYIGGHRLHEAIVPEALVRTVGLRTIYMGAFAGPYDFEPIVAMLEVHAAKRVPHHLFILGHSGKRYQRLRQRIEHLPNVTFTGWVPRERAYAIAKTCHLGWLPLGMGHPGFAPNKLFEYPALGLPVLTPQGSDAAKIVERHGIGWCYEPMGQGLAEKIAELSPEDPLLKVWRTHCDEFSREVGDAKVCSETFADLIESVSRQSATERVGS